MSQRTLTIPYPDDLLLSLKETPEEFEAEARVLLAVNLFEMGRISTGRAAELAGQSRGQFLYTLSEFKVSPFAAEAEELDRDVADALA